MSTRYVWDKCGIAYTVPTEESSKNYQIYSSGYVYLSTEITKNSDGTVDLSGTIISGERYNRPNATVPTVSAQSAATYRYLATNRTGNRTYIESPGTGYWILATADNYLYIKVRINDDPTYTGEKYYFTVHSLGPSKGNVIGNVSASESSAYPSDGISGSNWYAYKGSDSIDPISITYSADNPERGEAVTIIVGPTENALGGTISYLYQYSINGGKNWLNAGAAITDLEKEITVPENAEQFMARVRAQDDIGFISADYVTGANLEVQVMRLWVGVNNVARKSKKLWVGVDGVARQAVRAWVGDENGKARRWF